MKVKSSEVAERLFMKLETAMNGYLKNKRNKGRRFRDLRFVRISTDERVQENKPEKGIFYIKFYWHDEEKPPTIVGIGFPNDRNEIWLVRNAVPNGFQTFLHDSLGFGVIAMKIPFEQIKGHIAALIARMA